jgi:hypothetical protein
MKPGTAAAVASVSALLRGAGGDEALLPGVAQNGGAELLIHEDAGTIFRDSPRNGGLEGVEDHLFRGGNLRRLFRAKGLLPAEHVFRERCPVVKEQHVEGLVVTNRHGC